MALSSLFPCRQWGGHLST